jgi:hypothetical protein
MKKIIIFLLCSLGVYLLATAQSNEVNQQAEAPTKTIVLVNTASWCPACKANSERVEKNVLAVYMSDTRFEIIINDLSNEETKTLSNKFILDANISEIAATNKSTGMIYFIDSSNKKILGEISVTKITEEIKRAFIDASNLSGKQTNYKCVEKHE